MKSKEQAAYHGPFRPLFISHQALYVVCICALTVTASIKLPNIHQVVYAEEGDLVLGGLFRVHKYSADKDCGSGVRSSILYQSLEGMVYGVNLVNNLTHVLPNITLGFHIVDDCSHDQVQISDFRLIFN